MRGLLAFSRLVDNLNSFVGKAVSWLLLVAVLISAGNAFMRRFFSISSNAWLEAQWYLFSAVFLLAAAWTLLSGDHVKVDLLYQRVSRRTQLWIEVLGTLLFLMPFCVVTVFLSWPTVVTRFISGEVSNNTGGLALWPVWVLIPCGFGLLAIQGLSELVKRVAILRGIIPDPVAQADADAAALEPRT